MLLPNLPSISQLPRQPLHPAVSSLPARWTEDPDRCRLPTTSTCDAHDWLFVLGTGRSGSTTLLNMLNAVPQIQLSGENGMLIPMLNEALALTNRLPEQSRRFGTAWWNQPNQAALRSVMCDWLLSLVPRQRPPSLTRGFKSINPINSTLPFLLKLLPKARYIINYRKDLKRQSMSTFWKQAPVGRLSHQTQALVREVKASGRPMFEMPLEEFSTARFNRLLSWVGVEGCRYTGVAHSNAAGSTKVNASRDAVPLVGVCRLNLTHTCRHESLTNRAQHMASATVGRQIQRFIPSLKNASAAQHTHHSTMHQSTTKSQGTSKIQSGQERAKTLKLYRYPTSKDTHKVKLPGMLKGRYSNLSLAQATAAARDAAAKVSRKT